MGSIDRAVWRRSAGLWLLIAVAVGPSSGCALVAAGAVGAGGYAYARGDVDRAYPYAMDPVWNATLMAVAESELAITHQAKDQLTGRIDAQTATGDRVKIVLGNQGSITNVNVRVNTFGNKRMSTALLARIESHLPAAQAPASYGPELLPPSQAAAPAMTSHYEAPPPAGW
jgi:hypothetical protein